MIKRLQNKIIMILAAIMIITGLPQISKASSNNQIKTERLAGNNRFETAVKISQKAYDSSNTVILASSTGEADALTGTILATSKDAPLLLIQTNKVPESIQKEIKRLGAKKIYILGGTTAVSKSVEDDFKKKGYTVKRISGKNREETAIKVANEVNNKSNEFFLTLGYGDLADALAIGPVSAMNKTPILLTKKDNIPATTLNHIVKTKPNKITIIGGTNAISKNIEKQIPQGIKIERISGTNRIDTSVQIAKKYYKSEEIDKVILANGITIADALVGGHLAAKNKTPIILTNSNRTNQAANKYIADLKADLLILGGDAAINETVIKKMIEEINTINDPDNDKEEPPVDNGNVDNETVEPPLNINPNKIMNRKDLTKYLEYAIDIQLETIEITYYGEDFEDGLEVDDFLRTFEKIASSTTNKIWKDGVYQKAIKIVYKPLYSVNKVEEAFIQKEISRILQENITPNMSEFDKVRVLYNYIYDNTTYSTDTIGSRHSAYTLFKEKKGVCAAYGKAYVKLMDAIGVDSMYIVGNANNGSSSGSHGWNKVKIDEDWYNIDPTWGRTYKYFLKSDEMFYKTHTPNNLNKLPVSNNTQYDHLISKY